MPRIFNLEQGSDEWFALRRGVITGTRAQEMLQHGTSKVTTFGPNHLKSREQAAAEIAMERLDHAGKPRVTGAALRRGNDFEQEAIEAYTFNTGNIVEPCGFALHSDYKIYGCSPDGLVGDKGMVQIKVPTSVLKHVDYLETGMHAAEYGWQLLQELYVMDREWTDIVSYNPEAHPTLQLAKQRFFKPVSWKPYEALLKDADSEIEAVVARLKIIQNSRTERKEVA